MSGAAPDRILRAGATPDGAGLSRHVERAADLAHITSWVFDLDNTLYPADCNLFRQIDANMAAFIERTLQCGAAEARRRQKDFYVRYGTTMAGLMAEHGVPPHDFLAYVHDIDLSPIAAHPELAAAIARLPGKRYVFTNGSVTHAENVMAKLGIGDLFDDIFDIEKAEWTPKPHRQTYERFLSAHGIEATGAAMFEDLAHNLLSAYELGMTTVLVASDADWIADEPAAKRPARRGEVHAHVHHVTDDIAGFLAGARLAEGAV